MFSIDLRAGDQSKSYRASVQVFLRMLCHRSTLDTLTSSYCHVTLCHWPPGRSSTFSRPHPPVTWGSGPGPGPSGPSLCSPCCGKVERVIVSSSVIRCHSSAVEAGGGSLATRGECPIRQLSHKAEAAEREWERRGENERGRPGGKNHPLLFVERTSSCGCQLQWYVNHFHPRAEGEGNEAL